MTLPFKVTRSISFEGISDPLFVVDRLERGLESLRAKQIKRHETDLEFAGGIFRPVLGQNLLSAVDFGRLEIEPYQAGIRVTYHLRFVQVFFLVSLMVLGLLGPAVMAASHISFGNGLLILAASWVWLLGGNVVITLHRFPRWLRATIVTA